MNSDFCDTLFLQHHTNACFWSTNQTDLDTRPIKQNDAAQKVESFSFRSHVSILVSVMWESLSGRQKRGGSFGSNNASLWLKILLCVIPETLFFVRSCLLLGLDPSHTLKLHQMMPVSLIESFWRCVVAEV